MIRLFFHATLLMMLASGLATAQDMAKVGAANVTVTLDNEKVRVMELRLKAGEKLPMHSHPASIVCPLTAGKIKAILPDGKSREVEFKQGQAIWGEAVVHANEAVTDVHVMIIELKEAAKEQKETKKQ